MHQTCATPWTCHTGWSVHLCALLLIFLRKMDLNAKPHYFLIDSGFSRVALFSCPTQNEGLEHKYANCFHHHQDPQPLSTCLVCNLPDMAHPAPYMGSTGPGLEMRPWLQCASDQTPPSPQVLVLQEGRITATGVFKVLSSTF